MDQQVLTGPLDRLYDSVAQFFRPVPVYLRPIRFRVVETTDELKSAMRLVYREYLRRGYVNPNPHQLKISVFHALPETTTFVAVHQRLGVIGTTTLILDSPLGLPMDEVYKRELDQMRQRHRLAEISMLTLDHDFFGRGVLPTLHAHKMILMLRLFKVMFDYLRTCTGTTELVACFNPRHRILYDFLHLQSLGGLKSYSVVNGHPAVAGHLNIGQTRGLARSYPVLRFFYGRPCSAARFARKLLLGREDLQELFLRLSPVLASASPSELTHIKQRYPSVDLDRLLTADEPVPVE
ncbi:MAG: hypothetical protein HYZ92_00350 [Candidatus Omnitrophica bacterium]|nr:hypothetical protein [Candidatus Omnitrophota bacterium]